jgi:hypothetical protein
MKNVWSKVEDALVGAEAITWDECHKIYILMDGAQVDQMEDYGYDPIIRARDTTPEEMLSTLKDWYEHSCGLRFIQAVATVEGDPNEGFTSIIGQFEDDEDEEDDD